MCGCARHGSNLGPCTCSCPEHESYRMEDALPKRSRRMTDEEAAAVLTLVRGGWLKLELIESR